jgi:hypothetical protein
MAPDPRSDWKGTQGGAGRRAFHIMPRVVAAGFRPERPPAPSQPMMARASLALVPYSPKRFVVGSTTQEIEPKEIPGVTLGLADWPETLDNRLATRSLVLHVVPAHDARPPSLDHPEHFTVIAKRALRGADERLYRDQAEAARVSELWKRLMAPGVELCETKPGGGGKTILGPWRALEEAIAESQGYQDTQDPRFAGVGAPREVILPTHRADLALSSTLRRAGNVLQRIAAPRHFTSLTEQRRWLHDEDLDRPIEDGRYRSWLRPRTPVEELAKEHRLRVAKNTTVMDDASDSDALQNLDLARIIVTDAIDQSEEIRHWRWTFANAGSASERHRALHRLEELGRGRERPIEIANAIARGERAAITAIRDRAHALHDVQMRSNGVDPSGVDKPFVPPTFDEKDAARRRWFSLLAFPTLSRLFNLTIDLEFDVRHLVRQWPDLSSGKDFYLYVASTLGYGDDTRDAVDATDPEAPPLVWSLAKFRMPEQGSTDPAGVTGHFWPCSVEEAHLALVGRNPAEFTYAVPQSEGVVDLSAGRDAHAPRFDIVTVDMIATIEAERRVEIWRRDSITQDDQQKRYAPRKFERPSDASEVQRLTHRTGGLALVDRRRPHQLIAEQVNNQTRIGAQAAVLDAGDLTTGHRLDVAVWPRDRTVIEWRALNNRRIEIRDPKDGPWIMDIINRHVPAIDRIRLDANTVAVADAVTQSVDFDHTFTIAEEIVAVWQGDPLGIECRASRTFVPAEADLAIDQTVEPISSETSDRVLLPPPLRFGARYHFGMRPVFLGGVTMPLHEAQRRYTADQGQRMIPPASEGGRRFLRHERIDAPMLALTKGYVDQASSGSPFPIDAAATAVVRTVKDENRRVMDAESTPEVRRVLVATPVALDFAGRHGTLDSLPVVEGDRVIRLRNGSERTERVIQPRDGLANVRFQATPRGGFPVLVEDALVSRFGRVTDQVEDPPPKSFFLGGPLGKTREGRRGDPVFEVRPTDPNTGATRPLPYYPDPAALTMYLAIRRRHGDLGFLAGPAIPVPLYGNGVSYPDAMPVVIDVKRITRRSPRKEAHQRDVIHEPTLGYLDERENFSAGTSPWLGGTFVRVQRVVVELAPGEDFDLVAWTAPDTATLWRWFDIVEGIAALAVQSGNRADPNQACIQGIDKFVPGWSEWLERALSDYGPDTSPRCCGAGGLPLPSECILKAVAEGIVKQLASRPITEIAATRVIRIVHAVSTPQYMPTFRVVPGAGAEPTPSIKVIRRNFTAKEPSKTADVVRDDWITDKDNKWDNWGHTITDESGASETLLGGFVGLDLDTTHSVDLMCETPFPSTSRFDDVHRGRTREQRRNARNARKTQSADASRSDRRDNQETYGFAVDGDGSVTLPRPKVVLASVEAIAPSDLKGWKDGVETIDILLDENEHPRRYAQRHTFTDTLARRLDLSLVAYSRFADLLTLRAPTRTSVKPGDQLPAIAGEQSLKGAADDRVSVWLPSTKRPDRIDPKSLLPGFVWTPPTFAVHRSAAGRTTGSTTTSIQRRTVVRVRIKRPWFTSGENERLGLVIWPPNLFSLSPADLATGKVPPPECEPAVECGPLANPASVIADFRDEDLGPGGAFVTRWGADPIRKGPGPDGWFMPAEAFADLRKSDGKAKVHFVPDVIMPVPRGEERNDAPKPAVTVAAKTAPDVSAKTSLDRPAALRVSLLTYEPKFDVDDESWFVDVGINPMDMAAPFLRLGLVRYQEHAAPNLQVSEPVAAWIQLLPTRTVDLTVEPPTSSRTTYRIDVAVSGRASIRSAPLPEEHSVNEGGTGATQPESALLQQRHRPVMRMALLKRAPQIPGWAPSERIATDPADVEQFWDSGTDSVGPTRSNEGLTWRHSFEISEDPRAKDGSIYTVFIEEIERMLPGSYAQEPIAADRTPDELIDLGPRFAVRINVNEQNA